jgi:protein-tyrosine-phosphatase
MTKKVIVICRHNQARSIAASAALRRFYPDLQILSAGTNARPRTPIPTSILDILDEWELYERDLESTLTTDLPEVSQEDFVLCADAETKSLFIQQHEIDLDEFTRIHILQDFSKSKLEIPIDPLSMDLAETKIQLARCIVLAIRATRKFLEQSDLISASHIPAIREEHIDIQNTYLNTPTENRLIIDTGFSIPNPEVWSRLPNRVGFNPRQFPNFNELDLSGQVLTVKHEIDNVAGHFLSLAYHEWIASIALRYKVDLVSQPYEELPLNRKHEAILGLIHS